MDVSSYFFSLQAKLHCYDEKSVIKESNKGSSLGDRIPKWYSVKRGNNTSTFILNNSKKGRPRNIYSLKFSFLFLPLCI